MKHLNSSARLALIPLLLSVAFSSVAQQATNTNVTVLENVVVTGVAPQSALTLVTDPKKPRQPLPASDGTDYLQTIPGFSAIRNGGSNSDPVLRGMFGSRLNILMNGTTMLGACPSRMDAPTSYISPATFDTLTVIKGPQSVLWGPVGSAGTIRFDRETPGFTEPGILFDGSITGGSWGRNDQTADLAVGNEKVYVRATGNRSHSQDYEDGDGNRVQSRWTKWNTDVALGLTPDSNTLIELTAGTGDGEARYAGRDMDGSKFKRESLGLRFVKDNIGDTLQKLEAQVYYNYADHVMDNYTLRDPDPNAAMMPMRNPRASNVDRTTWGGRFAATLALAENTSLVTGVDYQENSHSKRAGGRNYKSLDREKDASFSNTGLFAELTWQASDAGRVIAGARIDRATAKDHRPTVMMMMKPMPNPTADQERKKTLASGFARYEHSLSNIPATLYIGLGHAERYPDYWELFSPDKGPQGSRNAFEGIKPEKTTQLDFGAQYRSTDWDAWFSAYIGQVNDYILFDYNSTPKQKQARNIKANIMGAELGASYKLTPQWTLGGSLAYAWGENRSDGTPMAQMPPLEVRLNAGYDNGTWSAGALWRVVAKQTRYSAGYGNVVSKDFGPSSGFGILSVNGGYVFNKHANLTLGVDNLFNKTYREHLNLAGAAGFNYAANTQFNEPGRTLWANLALKF